MSAKSFRTLLVFGTIGSLTPASQDLAALHASSAVAIQDGAPFIVPLLGSFPSF